MENRISMSLHYEEFEVSKNSVTVDDFIAKKKIKIHIDCIESETSEVIAEIEKLDSDLNYYVYSPALYIDGRRFRNLDQLKDWLENEYDNYKSFYNHRLSKLNPLFYRPIDNRSYVAD